MKRILSLAAACLIFLPSCQKELASMVDPNELRFTFEFPGTTKVTATNFEVGDNVSIYATTYDDGESKSLQVSGNWINNECLTFNGSDWAGTRKLYWPESKMDVYAIYPYQGALESATEQPFSVATDQSTEKEGDVLGGYEASDLLWACTQGVYKLSDTPDPVSMSFSHLCSKVVIKLVRGEDFSGTFPDNAKFIIHNTVPEGVFDVTTGSISKYVYGDSEDILCHKSSAYTIESPVFEAIVIPQRITSKRPFLEYLTDKVSYLVQDTYNFKPGYCYTYTLTINSSPEQIVINIGGEVEGWN